jgi:hypothetical protein
MSEDRRAILNMVESGQISSDEAVMLLDALNQKDTTSRVETAEISARPADVPAPGNWWVYPTAGGAVVMAIGAPLVALGIIGQSALFLVLCCGWIPFLIGLAILTVGVWSRSARWLYLRIEDADRSKRTIAFGFPLPLTLSAWVMRIIRPFIPQIRDLPVEEMILAVRDGDGEPIFIEVQDDDDDEYVMIFIG